MLKDKFTLKEMIYISLLAVVATVSKVPIRALSNFLTSSVGGYYAYLVTVRVKICQ